MNNWDITVAKKFPFNEQRYFELRGELYNAFNHSQWVGVDSSARFDPTGQQVNARFGQVTAARPGRYIPTRREVLFLIRSAYMTGRLE